MASLILWVGLSSTANTFLATWQLSLNVKDVVHCIYLKGKAILRSGRQPFLKLCWSNIWEWKLLSVKPLQLISSLNTNKDQKSNGRFEHVRLVVSLPPLAVKPYCTWSPDIKCLVKLGYVQLYPMGKVGIYWREAPLFLASPCLRPTPTLTIRTLRILINLANYIWQFWHKKATQIAR